MLLPWGMKPWQGVSHLRLLHPLSLLRRSIIKASSRTKLLRFLDYVQKGWF
jgi:hypothetical protein